MINSEQIAQVFEYLNKRDECPTDNDYDGRMGARISSIFVIMVTSAIGTLLPLLSSRYSFIRLPPIVFLFVNSLVLVLLLQLRLSIY